MFGISRLSFQILRSSKGIQRIDEKHRAILRNLIQIALFIKFVPYVEVNKRWSSVTLTKQSTQRAQKYDEVYKSY